MQMGIRRLKRSALGTAAFAGVMLAWGGFAGAHGSYELRGHLHTHQVDCASLCTEGPITGDLSGKLEFTLDSLDATPTPNVSRYVGTNTITTPYGSFSGPDYGVWNLATGQFTDYTEITSGTGIFKNAHGTVTIAGVFDPVAGTGSSEWRVVFAPH